MKLYIGHYIEVLKSFHEKFCLDFVLVESEKCPIEIKDFCSKNRINIVEVKTGIEIDNWVKQLKQPIDVCIVASFGIILRTYFISRVPLIINIHPGNLQNCRGRHPLPAAIYQGLSDMTLTAHLIDSEEIDAGPVIAEFNAPIDYSKNYSENYKRLREMLPLVTEFILWQLKEYNAVISQKWDVTKSKYFGRLSKESLNAIINAESINTFKKNEDNY